MSFVLFSMAYLPSTGEDVVGCGCTRPRLGQLRALLRSVLKLKKLLRVCSRRRSIQLQKRGIFAYQPSHKWCRNPGKNEANADDEDDQVEVRLRQLLR